MYEVPKVYLRRKVLCGLGVLLGCIKRDSSMRGEKNVTQRVFKRVKDSHQMTINDYQRDIGNSIRKTRDVSISTIFRKGLLDSPVSGLKA